MSQPNRPKVELSGSWPPTSVRSKRASIGFPGTFGQANGRTATPTDVRPRQRSYGHASGRAPHRSRRPPRCGRRCSPSGFSWLRLPSADSKPAPSGPHGSAWPKPRDHGFPSQVCLAFATPAGCRPVHADPPQTADSAAFVATCCRLTAELQEQEHGHGFVGRLTISGTTRTPLSRPRTRRNLSGARQSVPS